MSAFTALENACSDKTFESLSKLTPGQYVVTHFKLLKTRYGPRVAVLIGRVYYYLPNYVSDHISTEKDVSELNSVRYEMRYMGKNVTQKNRVVVRFMRILEERMDHDLDEGVDVVG